MAELLVQTKANSPLFHSLQAGRGIAALAVVLYHCEGLFSLGKYWATPKTYFKFGASGVNFFFVLSGIVILHAHWFDLGRPDRLGSYAWKRFRRIYPIYWVVLLVLLSLYFAFPTFGQGFERQPAAIVDSFFLLPVFQMKTIIAVAWTLQHEILFYIVFAVLLIKKRWGQFALGLWMLASFACIWLPPNHPWLGFYLAPIHLLFGMGMLGRMLWQRFTWNGGTLAVVGVVGFFGCAICDDLWSTASWLLPLTYGLFALLTCLGCMLIEKHRPLKIPRFLMTLGNASYSLYLVHYPVLSLAAKLIFRVWAHHPTALAIPFFLLLAIALMAGLLVHHLVEMPLLRLMNKRVPPRRSAA
jgi:peptidoglycan/LPS O-acetylase OafA/YrhL